MAIPTLFANLTAATGQQLDNNFAALGNLVILACTITGTNALSLTQNTNSPTITVYSNNLVFAGIAAGTNSTSATAAVGLLGALPIYRESNSGPVALTGNEIHVGAYIVLAYDSALNGGSGGFHLLTRSDMAPLASPAFTGTPTAATAAADTNTTQLATTAYVIGQASGITPVMDGAATVGASLRYARGDHAHPTDTSRAPLASPTFTGTTTVGTELIISGGMSQPGYQKVVPVNAFSQTINNDVTALVLKPAGALASGTVTMPSSPADGQQVSILSSQTITALTVSANAGQSIQGAATTITSAAALRYMYVTADTAWYRIS